ncbi:hypothetical protein [Dysgonomonas sp. 511]|uniref:hypothetical protein n=1 Tax=Dysgonomonas sp. 511 TaxID=2302930 RepID=UPI0013D1B578|nr:hypothetical protein [Dysgonomonas sp. 511]NDV78550.1 hypothetical protein [Dysgonomonas sp. 511]
MEIIGVDSGLYKELARKIDFITDYVVNQKQSDSKEDIDETRGDGYEICTSEKGSSIIDERNSFCFF